MFKYVETILNEKMEELDREKDQQEEEQSIYRKRLNYINSYIDLRNRKSDKKREITIYGVGIVILTVLCALNPTYNFLLSVAAIGLILNGISISEIVKIKKELKSNYSDILSLTEEEVEGEQELLNKILRDYYAAARDLKEEKDEIKREQQQIKEQKKMLAEMNDPYYQADTEEEYNFLIKGKEEAINLLTDYLDEKVDYSKIHFDNSIDETIQYSENSKKLMKKM